MSFTQNSINFHAVNKSLISIWNQTFDFIVENMIKRYANCWSLEPWLCWSLMIAYNILDSSINGLVKQYILKSRYLNLYLKAFFSIKENLSYNNFDYSSISFPTLSKYALYIVPIQGCLLVSWKRSAFLESINSMLLSFYILWIKRLNYRFWLL